MSFSLRESPGEHKRAISESGNHEVWAADSGGTAGVFLLDQRVSDRMPGGSAGKMVVVESTAIGGRADQTPVDGPIRRGRSKQFALFRVEGVPDLGQNALTHCQHRSKGEPLGGIVAPTLLGQGEGPA